MKVERESERERERESEGERERLPLFSLVTAHTVSQYRLNAV